MSNFSEQSRAAGAHCVCAAMQRLVWQAPVVFAGLVQAAFADGYVNRYVDEYYCDVIMGRTGKTLALAAQAAASYYQNVVSGGCVLPPRGYRPTVYPQIGQSGGVTGGSYSSICKATTIAGDAAQVNLLGNSCPGEIPQTGIHLYQTFIFPFGDSRCPSGSSDLNGRCVCDPGSAPVGPYTCARVLDDDGAKKPGRCSSEPEYGNPVLPSRGGKREVADLGINLSAMPLKITYNSVGATPLLRQPGAGAIGTDVPATDPGAHGRLWFGSLHRSLAYESAGLEVVRVSRGDGTIVTFRGSGRFFYSADADVSDRLALFGESWLYHDVAAGAIETYSGLGQLLSIDFANGRRIVLRYSTDQTPVNVAPAAGYLIQAYDDAGRFVSYRYGQNDGGKVGQVIDVANEATLLDYSPDGNLSHIRWPDGNIRTFVYDRPGLRWALTGVVDEASRQTSVFSWDDSGRAKSTERAGGAGMNVVAYVQPPTVEIQQEYDSVAHVVKRSRVWAAPTSTAISLPGGSESQLQFSVVNGLPRLTSQTQSAGSGCAASSSGLSYDPNGNVTRRDDFNGHRACMVNDLGRNLEVARVEGLPLTAVCDALTPVGAAVPPGSRKVSTTWHPVWRLQSQVAEPGRRTTYVYNGQPDPFNGYALAECAVGARTLPDGNPIAVLCKQVEQATLDTDGHLGFNAPIEASVAARVQSWTYNAHGQVLTAKGPRTDVVDTTTYVYYTDTTADHTLGDLRTMTNALGKTTTHTKYNPYGQVLESIDPNDVLTVNTYDLRQRLKSTSIAGQTTRYDYWPTGLLKQVTLPDDSFVAYEYDDAHRLWAVTDNKANRIEYTLDNVGNRTAENVKDPAGNLARQLSRIPDALGRIQQVTGRE